VKCKICNSDKLVKNGKRQNKQCYICKDCGHQFTSEFGRHDEWEEKMALSLYVSGLSFRTVADLFFVNCSTIMRWIRKFSESHYSKPMPIGKIEVELDEMRCFINSKKQNCKFGRHTTEQIEMLTQVFLERSSYHN
jgi:transposase-like protein